MGHHAHNPDGSRVSSWPPEAIVAPMGSDQEHAEWMQKGWQKGYADAVRDVARIIGRVSDPAYFFEVLARLGDESPEIE